MAVVVHDQGAPVIWAGVRERQAAARGDLATVLAEPSPDRWIQLTQR